MSTIGVLLAAGRGSRMGRPKALVADWLARGLSALEPCDEVLVVLGAQAEAVQRRLEGLVGDDVSVVVATDWAEGMGASLRAALAVAGEGDAEALLVTLVDLPDVGRPVVARVVGEGASRGSLRRAAYDGEPGHPVLLGRDHWEGVAAAAVGDQGARDYLRRQRVELVECGDLATGRDVDSLPVAPTD
ncbi:nucleotidyltransferase family protein [Nocardioides aequoreus]|uniref:nucleotidyltransferase family protein n=1 Tax=Nocardioides aequoreus TaxID=397278 RepID=UPI0004C337DF|nr:nucleotidyltransferase family protein [Nocardioides aequoreus]